MPGTALPDEVDRELEAAGRRGHRALVAGVIRDGTQVCRGWSTYADAPGGAGVFEIGSITKAFTGVLLADMALRGQVSLDDPLPLHLPDMVPAWRHRAPTLRELAIHRSGLPNTPHAMHRREAAYALGLRRRTPWEAVTAADYRLMLAEESPRPAPGARFRYSSVGVGLLGDALAAAAGIPYEQLLTERVLAPLGMLTTAVTMSPGMTHALLPGHSRRGDPRPLLQDLMPAAGSLRSTADDVLRFLGACLQPPAGVLGDALRLAQQPIASVPGPGGQIGLCWFVLDRGDGQRMVWHNGGTWGYRSFAGFAPDSGVACVVLSNTARSVDRVGLQLLEAGLSPAGQAQISPAPLDKTDTR